MNGEMLRKYLENDFKKVLIFDFDGTLFRLEFEVDKYRKVATQVFNEIDPNFGYREGMRTTPWINKYIEAYGDRAKALLLKCAQECEQKFTKVVDRNLSLINLIKEEDYIFHLWTNNTKGVVEKNLEQHNLLDRFTKTVTRDDVMYMKPNPEGFSLVKSKDFQLTDYLLIGDGDKDREAAMNAGIDFFEIQWK